MCENPNLTLILKLFNNSQSFSPKSVCLLYMAIAVIRTILLRNSHAIKAILNRRNAILSLFTHFAQRYQTRI